MHGLPESEPAFNIDTVFRRLVPDGYKQTLRAGMGIGAISTDVSISNFDAMHEATIEQKAD